MLRKASGEAEAGSLGSKLGQSAIARTSALRGSITIAVARFGWYVWATPARTSSVRAWIPASIVSRRSSPCSAPLSVSRSISLPSPSSTTWRSPLAPPSRSSSPASSPARPSPSTPTVPITGAASLPSG